jgi:hypothetical protein
MGQATADLPDPLAASAGAPNSTDDLLAQLADEEIERLLAETDNSVEPQPPEPSAPAAVIVPPTPVAANASPVASARPAAVVPPVAPPTAAPAEDLESIFTQLDDRDKAAAAVLPKVGASASTPNVAEEPSVAEALAAEMAEDAAQHARPGGGHSSAKAIDAHAIQDVDADAEAKPSLLVTLLALMSSPLDAFSDEARDLIGKAAILTMLNALCVLAYVIFFRR